MTCETIIRLAEPKQRNVFGSKIFRIIPTSPRKSNFWTKKIMAYKSIFKLFWNIFTDEVFSDQLSNVNKTLLKILLLSLIFLTPLQNYMSVYEWFVCTYRKCWECICWQMWYIHNLQKFLFISISKKAFTFLQGWNWVWKEIQFCTLEIMMEWRFHKFTLEQGTRKGWRAVMCIADWKAHTWMGRNSPWVSPWPQGYLINGWIYEQIKALILGRG